MNASPVRNAMNTPLQLLLLPERAGAAAVRLQVDAGGRILARELVATDGAPTVAVGHDNARQVLAVPGSDCLALWLRLPARNPRSEEHTSEIQSLLRISYAVFCLKKKKTTQHHHAHTNIQHTHTSHP